MYQAKEQLSGYCPNLYTVASGQFGKVFKGVLKSNDGSEDIEIAIKAPKVNLISSDSVNDFYREANTAVSFDHINVLKCLGMSEEPKELPYLVFELMHFGDLATILASNRVNGQSEKAPLLTQVVFKTYDSTKCNVYLAHRIQQPHCKHIPVMKTGFSL